MLSSTFRSNAVPGGGGGAIHIGSQEGGFRVGTDARAHAADTSVTVKRFVLAARLHLSCP